MEKLIGRKIEIAELQRCYSSDRSEFIIVYGRRRIGKTFLINNVFKDKYAFSYTGGHNITPERQLKDFAEAIQQYSGAPYPPSLNDWFDAFKYLRMLLESMPKELRKVIFLDEMPWIDSHHSSFVSALEKFWNSWAALRDDIFFIACGSATSWMVDKLIENQGGLHNRITNRIYLQPFTLNECEEYLRNRSCTWDRYQITQCYMVLGGVPFYLSLLNTDESLAQNIDELFFRTGGKLTGEFNELYNALFVNADKYIAVVKALSEKREGLTRQDMVKATKMSGGGLTKVLNNLEQCDFILSYSKFKSNSKNAIYRLKDFYTLFYYKFIENNRTQDKHYWMHKMNSPEVYDWQGFSFELICLLHVDQIKQRLGIFGILTNACSWRSNDEGSKAQIDLLIDRSDRVINLCEMKFSQDVYVITKEYENKLRTRMGIFRAESKTKKSIVTTFVTTFGVAKNIHSGIVQNEIVMDDLFVPNPV